VGKVAEVEEQMYPQRTRMVRQALELGLVALIVLTVSVCSGGSGAKGRAAEEASTTRLFSSRRARGSKPPRPTAHPGESRKRFLVCTRGKR
jgi:hypothetical protein